MNQLTISTYRYVTLLEDFTARVFNSGRLTMHNAGWHGELFSITYRYKSTQPDFMESLITMLTDIAMQENPIYQHSPKLQDMARDLRNTSLFTSSLNSLVHFVKYSRILHLEGYVTFRMTEYREKLDMMSYSLIKKMKLTLQD